MNVNIPIRAAPRESRMWSGHVLFRDGACPYFTFSKEARKSTSRSTSRAAEHEYDDDEEGDCKYLVRYRNMYKAPYIFNETDPSIRV